MSKANSGYYPAPGKQNPSKYPHVGANYQQYGEQPGYVYYPWNDQYYPDPKQQAAWAEQAGLKEPEKKPPGLLEQAAPIAVAGGALALGQGLGKNPAGFINGITDGLGGLFGGGGGSSAASTAASTGTEAATGTTGLIGGGEFSPSLSYGGEALFPGGSSAAGGGEAAATTGSGLLQTAPGTVGGSILPAAGIAAGAYTGYQQLQGARNALQGDDLTFQQQAALALPTFGTSFLYNPVKDYFGWGNQNRWKEEGDRLRRLQEQGVNIPQELIDSMPTGGRSTEDLVQLERDRGADEADIRFASSRDINDLKGHGQSIINYSTFAEKDPEWFNRSIEDRTAYANQLLDAGVVSEGRGQISIDWEKAPKPPWEEEKKPEEKPQPSKNNGGRVRVSPGVYR